jgi:hypothetical protein
VRETFAEQMLTDHGQILTELQPAEAFSAAFNTNNVHCRVCIPAPAFLRQIKSKLTTRAAVA